MRERAHLSQKQLAQFSGMGEWWMCQIENGRKEPNLTHLVAMHEALRSRVPDLNLSWLLTGTHEAAEIGTVDDNLRRRAFIAALGAAAANLSLPMSLDHERLSSPSALDPALLDLWDSQTEGLAQRRPLESPRTLLPTAQLHLRTLLDALDRSGSDRSQRRLMSIAAGTAAITAWVSLMAERRREMRDHLDVGEALAREVGDTDSLVLLLMLRADSHSGVLTGGLEGFPVQAQRALEEAMSLASRTTSITLHAPVVLRAAEEAAYMGDEPAALRLLDRGAEVLGAGRVREHPLRRHWVDWGWASYAGSAYNLLGRTREAIDALDGIDSPYPGHRPLLAADLASAHAQEGNLDEAGRLLGEALGQAMHHGVVEAARRVLGVRRRRLARWQNDPIVRDLDERLAAVL